MTAKHREPQHRGSGTPDYPTSSTKAIFRSQAEHRDDSYDQFERSR